MSSVAMPSTRATPPVTRPAPLAVAIELTMTSRKPTTTRTSEATTPLARALTAGRESSAVRPKTETTTKQAQTAASARWRTGPPGRGTEVAARAPIRCHSTAAECIRALSSRARTEYTSQSVRRNDSGMERTKEREIISPSAARRKGR